MKTSNEQGLDPAKLYEELKNKLMDQMAQIETETSIQVMDCPKLGELLIDEIVATKVALFMMQQQVNWLLNLFVEEA